jgi:hypothetical protein
MQEELSNDEFNLAKLGSLNAQRTLLSLQQHIEIIFMWPDRSKISRLYQAVCRPKFGFTFKGRQRIRVLKERHFNLTNERA